MINIGDIYWLNQQDGISHPHVIIEHNATDDTLTLCAITTNTRKISIAGNLLLEVGEGNLPKQSIIEVSKMVTIKTDQLGGYIGTLSEQRMRQILAGIRFIKKSFWDS